MQLQTILPKLAELGYQVIAISPDRPEKLRQTVRQQKLAFALLSDSKLEAARGLGIAYRVDAATLQALAGFGIDLQAASGEDHQRLPVPAVFVIDKTGKIAFSYVNPDYKQRLSPDVLLLAAQAALSPSDR